MKFDLKIIVFSGTVFLIACHSNLKPSLNEGSCAPNPDNLTEYGKAVMEAITPSSVVGNSTVPAELLLTSCNSMDRILIDGPEIFTGIADEIAKAKHEVDIAFFKWDEGSQAADKIGEGLRLAQELDRGDKKLLVRIMVDDLTEWLTDRVIDNIYNSVKDWNLDQDKIEFQLATYPHAGIGVLHEKYVVIDSKVVIVTGAQPEKYHDAPDNWHDTGYVFSGDVGLSVMGSFDNLWNEKAEHWKCEDRSLEQDCQEMSHSLPDRSWLESIDRKAGTVDVITATRVANGSINNSTNNPQDKAWLAILEKASQSINIITPNINDDAFQNAIVDAAKRGVKVHLITSKGFNQVTENLPGQGGDNQEIVGKLRQRMLEHDVSNTNLKICWSSRNGSDPVNGKGKGASHVKFLTADGSIAVVGSGNMDTQSWNNSGELNLVVDNAVETARLDETVFSPDFDQAVCSLIELYEGNNGLQDLVLSDAIEKNRIMNFAPGLSGDNDEARSAVLYDCPAGKVFRLYDDPDRDKSDDWTEIIVKRHLDKKLIGTFEQNFEDTDVKLIYHRNNGLDGKVSVLEISETPTGPLVDLYEGDNGTQNLLCSQPTEPNRTIFFSRSGSCDEDEARSLVLYNQEEGKIIRLFDHPRASRDDDWFEIIIKRSFLQKTINTFERSFEDADVKAIYHRNNGLQGKVSCMSFSSRPTGPLIDLYEGNNAQQNLVCSLSGTDKTIDFTSSGGCANDEARSLVLHNIPENKAILLFDSPSGAREDDWVYIRTKRNIIRKVISTFERNNEDADVDISYFRNNGLDGKVSRMEIKDPSQITGFIAFYEGNNGTQNKVCELSLRDRTVNFKDHDACDNDEARSAVLTFVNPGTVIRVYDSPSCSRDDDWSQIEVKEYIERYVINTFENSFENSKLKVVNHHDNGLDGKVSCVRIDSP